MGFCWISDFQRLSVIVGKLTVDPSAIEAFWWQGTREPFFQTNPSRGSLTGIEIIRAGAEYYYSLNDESQKYDSHQSSDQQMTPIFWLYSCNEVLKLYKKNNKYKIMYIPCRPVFSLILNGPTVNVYRVSSGRSHITRKPKTSEKNSWPIRIKNNVIGHMYSIDLIGRAKKRSDETIVSRSVKWAEG